MLWIVRTGSPWRDLPAVRGNPALPAVVGAGSFREVFQELPADADFEYVMVDGMIVRAHQHARERPKKVA